MIQRLLRIASWAAVVLIAVLSLLPGELRPHTMASGHIEHFVAYFITASALALSYRGWSTAILIAFLLSAYGGALEILQLWVPGRISQLSDFLVSANGAWAGSMLVAILLPFFHPQKT